MLGSYAAAAVVAEAAAAAVVAEADVDRPSPTYLRPPPPPPLVAGRQNAGQPYGNGGRGRAAGVVTENGRPP